MVNFRFYNPTKIIFGKDNYKEIGNILKEYGKKKVLMVYGGKSLKASGVYDQVVASLKEADVVFFKLGGVKPNPRLSLVHTGIEIARKEQVDMVLAVGGGSVIDTAKAIAAGYYYEGEVWNLYITEKQPEKVLDVGVILTIPAAGSESSDGSVITNEETLMKCSWRWPKKQYLWDRWEISKSFMRRMC